MVPPSEYFCGHFDFHKHNLKLQKLLPILFCNANSGRIFHGPSKAGVPMTHTHLGLSKNQVMLQIIAEALRTPQGLAQVQRVFFQGPVLSPPVKSSGRRKLKD